MNRVTTIACDGGCIGSNPSPYGITWAFRHLDRNGNLLLQKSGLVLADPGTLLENNAAEYIAAYHSLAELPKNTTGPICLLCDSKNTIGRLFHGYATQGIPREYLRKMELIQKVLDWECFTYVLLSGHPTKKELEAGISKKGRPVSIHNKVCDNLCNEQARIFLEALKQIEP